MRPPVHKPHGGARQRAPARSSNAAGYDYAWQRVRLAKLKEEPLCRFCASKGVVTPAKAVDHIFPIAARPELRLVMTNLRPLCTACHNAHTASGAWRSRLAD